MAMLRKVNQALSITHPVLAKEWDYDTCGANRRVWWKCSKGHEWSAIINHRARKSSGCPYCSGRNAIAGENDLTTIYPSIAKEWNYERNMGIKPEGVTSKSHKKVWWKCSKGHEWQAVISNRTGKNSTGCPYCSGKRHEIN